MNHQTPCHPTPRNPVLLLHGIDDTQDIFWKMAPYLRQQGWTVHALDLAPNDGAVGLEWLAGQVARYVNRHFLPNQPIDLVGFSMGGLIGRYYVQRLGGLDRIQRFVTISSPHQGTLAAYTRPNPGCDQMRPNSPFLLDLNRDVAVLEQINFTSIWTPLDLIIIPATSSELPVGISQPVWVGGHAWMITDTRSMALVTAALLEPLRHSLQSAQSAGIRSDLIHPAGLKPGAVENSGRGRQFRRDTRHYPYSYQGKQ